MSEQLQQMQEILQKSLIKIKKLELELAQAKENTTSPNEAIAIIGTGVRLAGNITSTKKLWDLLEARRSVISKIPKDRFDVDEIYSADSSVPGKTISRYGAFLNNDVRAFDADFFGISPREAKSVDPLQRMILEVVYEALENAGIASDSLKGSNTGVYIALGNSDYIQARFRSGNLDTVDVYDTTGIPFGTACGRVSYLYDWKGTSFALDAACASSLLAVHLANEDLHKKIIDTAIVASANLLLTPEPFVGLSKLGSLSTGDACKAFANDADGYVRGEGCGVVVLKRQSDAGKDNDIIAVLIKGSAVKHNGRSNGFTAPNPEIQIETIQEALKNANLSVNDIDYVEAHGIGNRFTDALEIQAIHQGYKVRNKPVYVGSVKANIGHLEAGTGMPMLFKVIEILKHKKIPAQINIAALNEDVEWNKINAKVSTETIDWKNENGQPLRAAINLSGYSGTNVHMIFEEAKAKPASEELSGLQHFVLSAKDATALKNTAQKYLNEIDWQENTLTEICYTLQKGRNQFDYSVSVIAGSKQDIFDGLNDFVQDVVSEKYAVSTPSIERNKDVAFLFTGQGAQYFGMCKNYYNTFDVFKNAVDECDEVIKLNLEHSIKDVLWSDTIPDKNLIHQTKYTQPGLFVVEYAISKLWMSVGVQPTALIGHSIGEIVALTIAGAIDLRDALKLVIARAALMNALPANEGSMASVFCNEENLKPLLQNTDVDLAAVNSIKNCTISGRKEEVAAFIEKLKEQHIKAVALNVSHAFHSRLMEPMLEKFTLFAKQFSFKQPTIPVISNLTGKEITREELSAEYFANHIRRAVQFSNGIEYLQHKLNTEIYVEVGPSPVLVSLAKQTNTNPNALWLSSAKRVEDDVMYFHKTLQQLYCAGIAIDRNQFYLEKKINRVALPTYGWNWKVYWENPVFGFKPTVNSSQPTDNNFKGNKLSTVDRLPEPKATRETLLAYMQIEAAKVLGLEAGQKVDVNKPYREQGFDSMMSGEFLSLMEKHIGSELKMEVIHLHNTPKDLHQYLIDTYYGGGVIDTTQAVTMADIMFNQEMEHTHSGDWHEIKPEDGKLLRWFKNFDKKLPSVK
ncbi:MAG: acyltransferase domain-containing protein [Chitinophagales bacterium]|nr:acyltransferase domain-containing protein [Chitinophagales bacterium]